MNQLILMGHVFFGVICLLAALWVFVECLQASAANYGRIKRASAVAAAAMWAAFLFGGYWYVVYYKHDKSIILNGPWPFAHNFFMETKEHLVIILLMLATYLPVTAANYLPGHQAARRLVLWVSSMTAFLALFMEGEGAIIALGVKAGLLSK